MDSEGQGWKDRALNHEDRIAEMEVALAERDRMLDDLYGDYEAEWTEERGQFVQHDRWLTDLRGRPAEGEVKKAR